MSLRTLIQAKIDTAKQAVDTTSAMLDSLKAEQANQTAAMDDAIKNFGDWMDYEPQAVKDKADALIAEASKYS